MKKILVTGANGFIGYHLSKKLLEEGNEVYLLDNHSKEQDTLEAVIMSKRLIEKYDVYSTHTDLLNHEELKMFFGDITFDVIYHLAAINGTANFYDKASYVIQNNFMATMNCLKYIKTKKFVFTSSCEAYASSIKDDFDIPTKETVKLSIDDINNPRWSYGGSKILEELFVVNYCKEHDIDYLILRYHNIYGVRDSKLHVIPALFHRILNNVNNNIDTLDIYGDCSRSFLYIKDCVKYTIDLCNKMSNDVFNVGIQEETRISNLVIKLLDIWGEKMKLNILSSPHGSVYRRCPDMEKTIKATGYKPEYDLESGLKDMFQKYKESGLIY